MNCPLRGGEPQAPGDSKPAVSRRFLGRGAPHLRTVSLDTELKKVRKTVDYLAANTNLYCVVNTTGTPYFQRQPLKDVVIWYGLSQGIKDGIRKKPASSGFIAIPTA